MDIQEIHERFDSWEFDEEHAEIILVDSDNNELKRIDVNYLLELWFNEQDAD